MVERHMTAKSRSSLGSSPEGSAEAKARLAAQLARAGFKRSRGRDAVVNAFLATPGHVSAEELTAIVRRHAPGTSYSTVYRALKLLAECGFAATHQFGDGQARYELALHRAHHDHLVCTSCGAIFEFQEPGIEEQQENVARRHGFEVESHRMELYGRCAGCIAGERRRSPGPSA